MVNERYSAGFSPKRPHTLKFLHTQPQRQLFNSSTLAAGHKLASLRAVFSSGSSSGVLCSMRLHLLVAGVLLWLGGASHDTCETIDGDCPDDCLAAGFAGTLGFTARLNISPTHPAIERVAAKAERYIASQGPVQRLDNPLTGLHTSLFYFCCHTHDEKDGIKEALAGMDWSSFPVHYDSFACNLDHDNATIYLHGLPSNQTALFSLAATMEATVEAAGLPVNHPRKSLFHMTLARVGWDDYPVDDVVHDFLADPAAWDFGSLTLESFEVDDRRYWASDAPTKDRGGGGEGGGQLGTAVATAAATSAAGATVTPSSADNNNPSSSSSSSSSYFELEVIGLRPYGVAPDLRNVDTGDLAGDLFFFFGDRLAFARACAQNASGAEFCNCEVTCDDNVYVQSTVRLQNNNTSRRSSSRNNNNRYYPDDDDGDAKYAKYAKCNPTADSTMDDYEYRCVQGGHGRVGRADVATRYATPGEACNGFDDSRVEPPQCRWKFEMSKKIGGFWYSTPAAANSCGGGGGESKSESNYKGGVCSWELVEHKKIVAAECAQGSVVKAVEATAGDCLAKLPQPLDRTSAGYYVCFFDFGAMRMSKDELLAPFRQAFDSEDPGDGGCPGLPLYDI